MEQLTWYNVLLLLAGFVLNVLVSVQKAIKEKGTSFSLGYWLKANGIEGVISLLCGFALLSFGKDIIELLGVKADDGSPLWMIHAFLICGYLGRDVIFRALIPFATGLIDKLSIKK